MHHMFEHTERFFCEIDFTVFITVNNVKRSNRAAKHKKSRESMENQKSNSKLVVLLLIP